ncbi:MAG: DUF115 domain-containing protein [Treponema sp.]|jgi:hypothetical protein|nr:DUF115 domain-containing protein [Treponema sp.]
MQGLVRNGKTLLSGIDPVRRAERTADAVSVRDRTLYLCPSPLYGYGLERLLARLVTESPNSAILCIEADPELYELTEKSISQFALQAPLTTSPGLRITNICESVELCAFVRNAWGERAFRRIETIKFTGGWQLYPELYDSLCEALRREIAAGWSNALTLAKLGRLYIRNALRNLTLISRFPSIAALCFGEAPVLVLGAGPSLDETLNALNRRFNESFCRPENRPFRIICVDTCLPALKDRNIVPDLAVILESQHWNLRDFIGCRGWNVPAAIDFSALPASGKILAGDGYLFMTPWTPLRIFERLKAYDLLPAIIPPLGSVGLSTVEIARRLSRGKIICAGLDFSFTEDLYHARSTPGHRSRLNAQSRFNGLFNAAAYDPAAFTALSKSGAAVHSNPGMQNYRDLFEREFAADPRLYDITGSGLPLGIKTLSPEEAFAILTADSEQEYLTTNQHEPTQTTKDFGAKVRGRTIGTLSVVRGSIKDSSLTKKLLSFFHDEESRLVDLRDILSGEKAQERLSTLIDECDYLWAHFPDYSGCRPGLTDISFLKRLRTEIDPTLALIERVVKDI